MNHVIVIIIAAAICFNMVKLDFVEDDEDDECILEDEDDLLGRTGIYPMNRGVLWKDGVLVYKFADNFTNETQRDVATEAIWHIENRTCIRFREKTDDDLGFIVLQAVDEMPGACGSTRACFAEEPRVVRVRTDSKCYKMRVWVHEMTHSLCLGHEHRRLDRDNYLEFSKCTNTSEIPTKYEALDTKGNFYDYFSNMHYKCKPCNGQPKEMNVKGCGKQINKQGLSVLDADKINQYYNCKGCYAHRWQPGFPADNVKENVLNFARREGDTEPVFLCRVYYLGSIVAGRYSIKDPAGICFIFDKATNLAIPGNNESSNVQVLGYEMEFPLKVEPAIRNATTGYRLISNLEVTEGKVQLIPVGRNFENTAVFAAIGEVMNSDTGKMETAVGFVYNGTWTEAYVVGGGNKAYTLDKFDILTCND